MIIEIKNWFPHIFYIVRGKITAMLKHAGIAVFGRCFSFLLGSIMSGVIISNSVGNLDL